MNRHFRVPPEHQVFWQDIKTSFKVYIIIIAVVFVSLAAMVYFMDK